MADPLKARVHLIVSVGQGDPFSFRTDVLTLTRDSQWVYGRALDATMRALLAIGQPAHTARVLDHTIEWVPSLRDAQGKTRG